MRPRPVGKTITLTTLPVVKIGRFSFHTPLASTNGAFLFANLIFFKTIIDNRYLNKLYINCLPVMEAPRNDTISPPPERLVVFFTPPTLTVLKRWRVRRYGSRGRYRRAYWPIWYLKFGSVLSRGWCSLKRHTSGGSDAFYPRLK